MDRKSGVWWVGESISGSPNANKIICLAISGSPNAKNVDIFGWVAQGNFFYKIK